MHYSVILNINAFGRCTKCHDFPHKTRLQCEINLVGERVGFGLTVRARIMVKSCSDRPCTTLDLRCLILTAFCIWTCGCYSFYCCLCCVAFSAHQASKSLPQTMFPLLRKLLHRLVQFYWYLWIHIIFVQATLCLFISPLGAQQQFLQWIFWLAGPANNSALHGAACSNVTSIWATDIKETPRQSHLDVLDLDTSEMFKFTALANQWIRILVQLARLPCVVGPQEFE